MGVAPNRAVPPSPTRQKLQPTVVAWGACTCLLRRWQRATWARRATSPACGQVHAACSAGGHGTHLGPIWDPLGTRVSRPCIPPMHQTLTLLLVPLWCDGMHVAAKLQGLPRKRARAAPVAVCSPHACKHACSPIARGSVNFSDLLARLPPAHAMGSHRLALHACAGLGGQAPQLALCGSTALTGPLPPAAMCAIPWFAWCYTWGIGLGATKSRVVPPPRCVSSACAPMWYEAALRQLARSWSWRGITAHAACPSRVQGCHALTRHPAQPGPGPQQADLTPEKQAACKQLQMQCQSILCMTTPMWAGSRHQLPAGPTLPSSSRPAPFLIPAAAHTHTSNARHAFSSK